MELPFDYGETWVVCQGYRGPISHKNSYALDFAFVEKGRRPEFYLTGNGCANLKSSGDRYVRSPVDGRVISIYKGYEIGVCKYTKPVDDIVLIESDANRNIRVEIAHIFPSVKVGEKVYKGQIIGRTLNSSEYTCPHIHLAIKNTNNRTIPIDNLFLDYNFWDSSQENAHRGVVVYKPPPLSIVGGLGSFIEGKTTSSTVISINVHRDVSRFLSAIFHIYRNENCNSFAVDISGKPVENLNTIPLIVYTLSPDEKFPNQNNSGGQIYYIKEYPIKSKNVYIPLVIGRETVAFVEPLVPVPYNQSL